MRRVMNLWPPLLFAGIRILEWDADFRRVKVRLGHHRLTSNFFHTQYGGSLFSMTDPFWSIMLVHALGPDYTVWDRRGEIEFVTPGRTAVVTEMSIDQRVVDELRDATSSGAKVLRWFESDVLDAHGGVVARVRKQVYVRRKPSASE